MTKVRSHIQCLLKTFPGQRMNTKLLLHHLSFKTCQCDVTVTTLEYTTHTTEITSSLLGGKVNFLDYAELTATFMDEQA